MFISGRQTLGANGHGWGRLATLVILGAAALAVAHWICGWIALGFDDSYNLWTARTLAVEGTYGTRLTDTLLPFDPAVTTGPTVLLPLALGLKVFGPTVEMLRVLLALGFALWMLLIAVSLAALWGPGTAAVTCALLCLLPPFVPLGVAVMGEVPGLALVVMGVSLLGLAAQRSEHQGAFALSVAAGGALGLAILAKFIMVLAVVSLAAVALAELAILRKRARGARHLAAVAVAAGLVLVWQLVVWVSIRSAPPVIAETWYAASDYHAARFLRRVAFVPSLAKSEEWQRALAMYSPAFTAIALAAVVLVLLVRRDRAPGGRSFPVEQALLILGAMAGCWIGWFLLVAGPAADARHLLPGVALGLIFAVRVATIGLAAIIRLRGRKPAGVGRAAMIGVALVTVLVGWGAVVEAQTLLELRRQHLVRRTGQEAVAAYLREHAKPGEGVAGWGWHVPWDVAFLAGVTPGRIEPTSAALDGLESWVVLIPELETRRWEDRFPRLVTFLAAQGSPAVADRGYALWPVSTSIGAIRSESGPPRLRSIDPNPSVAGEPPLLWGDTGPPPDPRLARFTTARAIGRRLTAFTAVEIDGAVVPSIYIDDNTIEFLVPPDVYEEPGKRRVRLRSSDGVSETLEWSVESEAQEATNRGPGG